MEVPDDVVTIAETKDEYVVPAHHHRRAVAPHVIVRMRSTDQPVIAANRERDVEAIAHHEIEIAARTADQDVVATNRDVSELLEVELQAKSPTRKFSGAFRPPIRMSPPPTEA